MDVEGPGDAADGFTVLDEVSGEFLLIGRHFLWVRRPNDAETYGSGLHAMLWVEVGAATNPRIEHGPDDMRQA